MKLNARLLVEQLNMTGFYWSHSLEHRQKIQVNAPAARSCVARMLAGEPVLPALERRALCAVLDLMPHRIEVKGGIATFRRGQGSFDLVLFEVMCAQAALQQEQAA